jgi:hypothetical protein
VQGFLVFAALPARRYKQEKQESRFHALREKAFLLSLPHSRINERSELIRIL